MPDCPPHKTLERLLGETLQRHEQQAIEAHVEQCQRCQLYLHHLTLGAAASQSSSLISAQGAGGHIAGRGQTDARSEAFFNQLKRIGAPTVIDAKVNPAASATDLGHAPRIDGYEILAELGRGAAGVVYRARHLKLNRLVALKVIHAGAHLAPEVRQRFRLEALAIARLQHKNIVQIYDVGEHDRCPFLSLELIEGQSLSTWMAGKPQAPEEAAKVIATIAKAVEYAHHQGVVHRDLKPGNVLLRVVPEMPGKRELKIADFGIAKILPQGGIADAGMTQTGEILGTPAYMAPEQARGSSGKISPAIDIYSLGAILYELLTGRPPFVGATALDTMTQAAWQDPVPVSLLVARVPQDLNTICLKCLEKDPNKRYPNAAELAADLGRFLQNEPIHARPLSWAGHAVRWTRRHRGLAAALAAVVILVVLLTVGSLAATAHFRALEQQQRALAHAERDLAEQKEYQRERALAAEQQAEKAGSELRQNLYFDQMTLAGEAALSPSGIGRVNEWLAPWATRTPDLRGWEWYYLNGLCHRDLLTLHTGTSRDFDVAWSPDGRRLAAAAKDGTVVIWDVAGAKEIRRLFGHSREVVSVGWSPDGQKLASASWDGTVKIWNTQTGSQLLSFGGQSGAVCSVAWSPDGLSLASSGSDRTVQMWDAKTGSVEHIFRGHTDEVRSVAWSPDGRRLASAGIDNSVRIWDVVSGKQLMLLLGHLNFVNAIAWSPDGKRLASASNDHTAKIWDTKSGAELATLHGHSIGVLSVAFSPDGSRLATSGADQTVRIWSATDGSELRVFRGHIQPVSSVKWSPDGTRLASASYDATIKLWSVDSGPEVPVLTSRTGFVRALAWSPDGRRVASGGADQLLSIWDVATAKELFALRKHTEQIEAVAWSPDGTRIATAGWDQTIRLWDPSSGAQLKCLQVSTRGIYSLDWSPDGRRLASAGRDNAVRIWDANLGTQVQLCQGHVSVVYSVQWSPDGKRLASSSDDRTVKVWDPANGEQLLSLEGHTAEVNCVAWSPDGRRLASASGDQTIKIWDANNGSLALTLRGHTTWVKKVGWSPDGTRLASISSDNAIKLWDTATGSETLTLESGSSLESNAIAWSPNGNAIASGAEDGVIRIYDAASGYAAARAATAKSAE
jgi:WD40 repeat protein